MIEAGQPAYDEIEVTLLGRGVGESCVVHYGNGQWMVVDTFLAPDPSRGRQTRPAAEIYLDQLGVGRDAVKHLVLTHFDSDHYLGIDSLHDQYTSARFWITGALKEDQFRQAYAKIEPRGDALGRAMRRASVRRIAPDVMGLAKLHAGTDVIDSSSVRIRALSPSEAAVQASCEEMADLLPGEVSAIRRQLKSDNRSSVALHVTAFGVVALLSGDVENGPHRFGWSAVLNEPRHQHLSRAQIVKIPHHGSAGADAAAMWDRLVEPGAPMLVAPFTSLRVPIPTDADCRRLTARGGRLWQAAPSTPRERQGVFNDNGSRPIVVPSDRIGIIRARKRLNGDWNIVPTPPAFEVFHSEAP
jgi:Metallo-beta-lactamase superfamily